MKKSHRSTGILVIVMIALAFPLVIASAQDETQFSISSVYTMQDNADVENAYSVLVRDEDEIAMMVHAEALPANDAVTAWWVIFNNPDACSEVCNADDFPQNGGDPDVQAAMLFADGQIIGEDGKASFVARLSVGDASRAYGFESDGLQDIANAEVHLVLRTHGQALPDLLEAQITTLNGGCENGSEASGEPGPNTCANLMASVHIAG